MLKLHGLYDNDHRRIRHSTLDELPSLISASALGTLVARRPAGAEPGRPALGRERDPGRRRRPRSAASSARASLRFVWHRLTGVATGIVIGPAARGRRGRAAGRHPPRGAPAAGRLPLRRRATRTGAPTLPRLGSIADISRVAREHDDRARRRRRAGDERAGRRAADRGVQGGRPRPDLPAPALRPARARDRAQPPRRAAGARLPLLRPAALDAGDEAGDGRRRLRPAAGRCSRRCCWRSRC